MLYSTGKIGYRANPPLQATTVDDGVVRIASGVIVMKIEMSTLGGWEHDGAGDGLCGLSWPIGDRRKVRSCLREALLPSCHSTAKSLLHFRSRKPRM